MYLGQFYLHQVLRSCPAQTCQGSFSAPAASSSGRNSLCQDRHDQVDSLSLLLTYESDDSALFLHCSCIVQNPDKQGQPGAPTAGPPPQYTDEQLKEFQGRSWIGIDDTSLLDVAGTELLLVGTQAEPIETGDCLRSS